MRAHMLSGVASLVLVAACSADTSSLPAPSAPATVTFGVSDTVSVDVLVEVADDPRERETGLMYRESLDPYRGMVFVFPTEQVHSFWMKNTYIPLDMIFINRELQVVGVVANAEPLTLDPRSVGAPSTYVVEVNAGFAAQHGIVAEARVSLSGVPTSVPY